jgi:hypothetical protein
MIKEYLFCVALACWWVYEKYNTPPPPLTTAQLQKKAKDRSIAKMCARMKRGAKYERLCGEGGKYAIR